MVAFIVSVLLSFSFALFYAYVLYWLDRHEREPKLLLAGAFVWGAVIAAGVAFVFNTIFGASVFLISGSEALTEVLTGSISAPFVEEALKGFAVLIVFLVFYKEFDSVLDGIVYAGVTALGFAATENVLYLFSYGYQEAGWEGLFSLFFLRTILGAWNHAFYTAFTGIGLALARLSRNWLVKVGAPLVGLGMAMFAHFIHNTIASFAQDEIGAVALFGTDWLGWLLMFVVIVIAAYYERGWIKQQLQAEVKSGLINQAQYKTAHSPWLRSLVKLQALFSGKYTTTRRFYYLCVELAYKKHQRARFGEERGNTAMIDKLRAEIGSLAPQISI
jgi:RsiW-degrading membrane proteinase PrsW (M82 family)